MGFLHHYLHAPGFSTVIYTQVDTLFYVGEFSLSSLLTLGLLDQGESSHVSYPSKSFTR